MNETARTAARAGPGLAQIFAACGTTLTHSLTQKRAVEAITTCRTAHQGGHVRECPTCGHQEVFYNSCRNRHCPKCQGIAQDRWLEGQKVALLPVEYHHVVFTVPEALNPVFLSAPRIAYGLLFEAVAETLQEVAANPRHLGATIGFTAILHTWTQTLAYHPHIHCIVPGGGLAPSGRWESARRGFLFPVRVLSALFRGKLLTKLEAAMAAKRLPGRAPGDRAALVEAARTPWVVFSKPPAAGAGQVLTYLSRYTHKIAISNSRIVSFDGTTVRFKYRDRADHNRKKIMALDAGEFARRFLLHVVPRGFMRIRHYGFLANACRAALEDCRKALNASPQLAPVLTWRERRIAIGEGDPLRCRLCRSDVPVVISWLGPPTRNRFVQGGWP